MLKNNISIGTKVIITAEHLSSYNKIGIIIDIYNELCKVLFKNKDILHYYRNEFRLLENGFAFQNTVFCKWCHKKNKYYVLNCKYYSFGFYYCPICLR